METKQSYLNKLNELLSTYQVHYQNLRSLHWNIQGQSFFELHLKYEELYTRMQVVIDDLAERILTLGGHPLATFKDYLKHSAIEENELIQEGKRGIEYILNAQKAILIVEKELLKISADKDDEGTNALLSDLIREKEKTNWMFSAWLVNQTEKVF